MEENKARAEEIREFLKKNVRSISIPLTGRAINIEHGGYGKYSRYDVVQHKYAGGNGEDGHGGYIEVLEIKNPPDGRCGIVSHCYLTWEGSTFVEWKTLKQAITAFGKPGLIEVDIEKLKKQPGFIRAVECNWLTPWFYAVGDEQLIGNFSFPEGLQDDPVYRFGRKFVVLGEDGVPAIKTCMGTRFLKKKNDYEHSNRKGEEKHRRLVHWDDGSIWDEDYNSEKPRPIEEGELWIEKAVSNFRQFLTGKKTKFEIDFIDGNKFVGKLVKAERNNLSAEGDYFLAVTFKNGKTRQGWVHNFKPDLETPDIVRYVERKFKKQEMEVARVEVKEKKVVKGGKKWSGVFYSC